MTQAVEFVDAVYVVMEQYEGPDLQAHVCAQPGGALTESSARRFFCHILAALRHAHDRGFIHCDVKPSNVRLNAGCDKAVLVDWGMARSLNGTQKAVITQGSPAYASPEQLTGYNPEQAWGEAPRLCAAADVWSLGVTLYEMLAGNPPFRGSSFEELVASVMRLAYDDTFAGKVGLSSEAKKLVSGILQLRPSERSTVVELCSEPWTLAGGDLPAVVELPASSRAMWHTQVSVLRSKGLEVAGGEPSMGLLDVLRAQTSRWHRTMMGLVYLSMVGAALCWHLNSEGAEMTSQWKFDL